MLELLNNLFKIMKTLNLKAILCGDNTILDGYISLFLPVFIVLSAIPVYAIILSHAYFTENIKTQEIAESITRSYYNSATWWYKLQYKDCQLNPTVCSKTNKEMSDISLKKAEEVKTDLEKAYKVKAEVKEKPPEIELNKLLTFSIEVKRDLPVSISFVQKEIYARFIIKSRLVDTTL